jgi:hypothetical protein
MLYKDIQIDEKAEATANQYMIKPFFSSFASADTFTFASVLLYPLKKYHKTRLNGIIALKTCSNTFLICFQRANIT